MNDPDSTTALGVKAPFLVRVRFLVPGEPLPNRRDGWQPEIPFRMQTGDNFLISMPVDLPPGRNIFQFELSDAPSIDPEDQRVVLLEVPFFWQTVP